jgi:RNA polymerase sigma factor (TIGR02999 family)
MADDPGDVTQLLSEVRKGDQRALDALLPLVYNELRRVAGSMMRHEREDHTLQPTALVHEAYVKLLGQRSVEWQNRAHFMAVAAQQMRRILVDHARSHAATKRGGGRVLVELDSELVGDLAWNEELLAVDAALAELARKDEWLARVVELRFFGGLTVAEAAEVLGVSRSTVDREWAMARAWLRRALRDGGDA